MKPKNEEVFRKKAKRFLALFHRGPNSLTSGPSYAMKTDSGLPWGTLLTAKLFFTRFCLITAILLFLLHLLGVHAQTVSAESVSGPSTAFLPAPVIITMGKRTLSGALASQGISQSTIARIAGALGLQLNLRRLQPEDTLQLYYSAGGEVVRLVYRQSPLDIFEVQRQEQGWTASKRNVDVDREIVRVAGTLESNLFDSIGKLGEKPRLVFDFAEIFAWVFDFAADSQTGDQFRMLVEKLYVKEQFVGYGRILAAEYESEGTVHSAIYFREKEHGDYYTPDGESLRRAFLKSPLNFSRISSGYNRSRPHPVLGGMQPHLAIDYAAPAGTPVWAVADGVVKFAGSKNGYGKTVILRHMSNYQTMYSHLSRFGKGIRGGAKVAQRQVIGYVGSTGLATGPHLDYRVVKDGRFVNPLKETFLPGKPLSQSSRPSFIAVRDYYLQQIRSQSNPKAYSPIKGHRMDNGSAFARD